MSDDPLLRRLRDADPAGHVPPPSDAWTTELAEAVMSTETPTRVPTSPPRRDRRWLVPAVAAAVLAVVGVGAVLVRPGDGPTPSATPATSPATAPSVQSTPPAQVPAVRAGGPTAGRCLLVSAENLRRMATAFDGTVTAVQGRTATLRVTRWWRAVPDQQTSRLALVTGMSPQLRKLVDGVRLQVGHRYLVTATDRGQVTACGFSAAYSPRLERLYAEAFGG